jgi:hypothetical protein
VSRTESRHWTAFLAATVATYALGAVLALGHAATMI